MHAQLLFCSGGVWQLRVSLAPALAGALSYQEWVAWSCCAYQPRLSKTYRDTCWYCAKPSQTQKYVERNKDNIFGLNSIAKTVESQAIVRESIKGVSALHILLRKDDVFIHQSDIKDMWLDICKTNATFPELQSEGSGHVCLILSAPCWEVELTGDSGRCWRGRWESGAGGHVFHSRHGAVTVICIGGSVVYESAMKGDVLEEGETTIPCCSFWCGYFSHTSLNYQSKTSEDLFFPSGSSSQN